MLPRMGIAVVLFVVSGRICLAKPSDLPGDIFQQCPQARDGQQLEGFPQRPDAVEAPRSAPVGTRELTRRAVRDAGTFEEQESPPARFNYREPTERRGTHPAAGWRLRDPQRESSEDERRQEMLRTTEPLDTLSQRPVTEGGEVATDEEVQLPPVALPEQRIADAQSWTPGFEFSYGVRGCLQIEIENERRRIESMRFPWMGWAVRYRHSLMWFDWSPSCVPQDYEDAGTCPPPIFISGSTAFANDRGNEPILEFKGNAIGFSMATIRVDAFVKRVEQQREFSERYRAGSIPGDAVVIPAHDCCGCRIMLWGDRPHFIVRYSQNAIRGFVDENGHVTPGPSGGFSIGGSCLQMGIR